MKKRESSADESLWTDSGNRGLLKPWICKCQHENKPGRLFDKSMWKCDSCGAIRTTARNIAIVTASVILVLLIGIIAASMPTPEGMYADRVREAFADKNIDSGERDKLVQFAARLRLPEDRAAEIENSIKNGSDIPKVNGRKTADQSKAGTGSSKDAGKQAAQVLEMLEQGMFADADTVLKDSKDSNLAGMKTLLYENIGLNVLFEYKISGEEGFKSFDIGSVPPGFSLTHRDIYRFKVTPEKECFLYIFQEDSMGQVRRLFPEPDYNELENPLKSDKEGWQIPTKAAPGNAAMEQMGFYLEKGEMDEMVYIVASSWKARDLEKSFEEYAGSTEGTKRTQLLEAFKKLLEARKNSGMKGIYYKEFTFKHTK